jgi:hypothetical protein
MTYNKEKLLEEMRMRECELFQQRELMFPKWFWKQRLRKIKLIDAHMDDVKLIIDFLEKELEKE